MEALFLLEKRFSTALKFGIIELWNYLFVKVSSESHEKFPQKSVVILDELIYVNCSFLVKFDEYQWY